MAATLRLIGEGKTVVDKLEKKNPAAFVYLKSPKELLIHGNRGIARLIRKYEDELFSDPDFLRDMTEGDIFPPPGIPVSMMSRGQALTIGRKLMHHEFGRFKFVNLPIPPWWPEATVQWAIYRNNPVKASGQKYLNGDHYKVIIKSYYDYHNVDLNQVQISLPARVPPPSAVPTPSAVPPVHPVALPAVPAIPPVIAPSQPMDIPAAPISLPARVPPSAVPTPSAVPPSHPLALPVVPPAIAPAPSQAMNIPAAPIAIPSDAAAPVTAVIHPVAPLPGQTDPVPPPGVEHGQQHAVSSRDLYDWSATQQQPSSSKHSDSPTYAELLPRPPATGHYGQYDPCNIPPQPGPSYPDVQLGPWGSDPPSPAYAVPIPLQTSQDMTRRRPTEIWSERNTK